MRKFDNQKMANRRRYFNKKLIPIHQAFIDKYLFSRRNPHGIYRPVFFCEDDNIAFVKYAKDDIEDETYGCVNMNNQLLVPFEYSRIFDYGHFLIAVNDFQKVVYNKKGQRLFETRGRRKTNHKAYERLTHPDEDIFKLSIRKISISNGWYKHFYVLDNGLGYVMNTSDKVGLILFSKLKLPFDYYAVSLPQNGFALGIIKNKNGLYDCQLLKVRSQIKREDSVHPTGIDLFTEKSEEEVLAFIQDKDTITQQTNSIVCYQQQVFFNKDELKFFPLDIQDSKSQTELEQEEEDVEEDNYHNPWMNYTHEEALYDALGGEMEAYWNID